MPADQPSYRFGSFVLEASERQLLRDGVEVRLRPKAFETLLLLVQRHGHVVRKDELMNGVWAETNVSEAVLTHCIAEVRRALDDDVRRPQYLKTISLTGYKFIAEVEAVGAEIVTSDKSIPAGRTAVVQSGSASSIGGPAAVAADRTATPVLRGDVATALLATPSPAIAVMPFVNLSADPENEYFCDGLSEELINGLTTVRGLRVVAHSSSFSFKGRELDAREIGRRLNVRWILEGSVRKSGNRVRISAQLIDAVEGYHAWSEQYDSRLEDVFAVQDEIAVALLARVKAEFQHGRPAPLVKQSTANMQAYQLYLKGRGFWHRRYSGFLQRAMECFRRVIEMDPGFALAHTGLADSFSTLGIWAFAAPDSVFPQATALADKALEIDETLAEAHASRALIRIFYDWEWDAAGRGMARAVDLNPGNALIRLWNAQYFNIVGRWDEAIAEVLCAQDLDPLSPVVNANVGWTFTQAHDQDRAIDELRKVLAIDPLNGIAHFYLGYAYAEARQYGDAFESFGQAIEATGGMPWAHEFVAWVHASTGDHATARKMLGESLARMVNCYVPSSAIALIHLGLGDKRAMFQWLTKAVEERDPLIPWMKFVPCFDPVRADPEFQALLRAVRLVD